MNQKALLIPLNSKQEIFLQDRAGHKPPPWGFFGGSVEEGETPFEAVIRETKEELDIEVRTNNLIFMGSCTHSIDGIKAERHFFLYKTEQKSFTVLEGRGGKWMDKPTVKKHLNTGERFEKIWQLIQENI